MRAIATGVPSWFVGSPVEAPQIAPDRSQTTAPTLARLGHALNEREEHRRAPAGMADRFKPGALAGGPWRITYPKAFGGSH